MLSSVSKTIRADTMADELQALLDKINEEGLKKAEARQEEILAAAKTDAARILDEAKAESKRLVEAARREADMLRTKGEQSLQQAARDVLLSLREQLQERMQAVARAAVRETLDPARLAEILKTVIESFLESGDEEGDAVVHLNPDQEKEVRDFLEKQLADDLVARVEIAPVRTVSGGFRLQRKGEDVFYDFSDEALAEALTAFVNPRLAEIVAGAGNAETRAE